MCGKCDSITSCDCPEYKCCCIGPNPTFCYLCKHDPVRPPYDSEPTAGPNGADESTSSDSV